MRSIRENPREISMHAVHFFVDTHERAGLPLDSITEIATATPGDRLFQRS